MLLEHIKRYDSDKIIKLVSIDSLRKGNMDISSKIHSVPALMLIPSKEIIYGKTAFDYLLLPPRGLFCSGNTRGKKEESEKKSDNTINNTINNEISEKIDEPSAFSLSGSVLSDNFSNIDDTIETIVDKNYKWDMINSNESISAHQKSITEDANQVAQPITNIQKPIINSQEDKKKMSLPTLEELQKQRDSEVFFK